MKGARNERKAKGLGFQEADSLGQDASLQIPMMWMWCEAEHILTNRSQMLKALDSGAGDSKATMMIGKQLHLAEMRAMAPPSRSTDHKPCTGPDISHVVSHLTEQQFHEVNNMLIFSSHFTFRSVNWRCLAPGYTIRVKQSPETNFS